jgi:nucleotide-binding universal stress UspA family protein
MFRQIVVGVDEHAVGRDAILLANNLLSRDGELTLAYICAGDPHLSRSASPAYEASERERGLQLLERAREQAQVKAGLLSVESPSVGRGLHELAERLAADLLVLGSCRRGLLGRVLIGDDTRAALNGASCAIAIAPAGYSQQPTLMREIGVGYDGSPESRHALELARRLAGEVGAELSTLEAVSLPANAYPFAGVAPGDEAYEQLVEAARRRVAALDGVEPHAAYGHAAEELAVFSASLDLLVVGSRGYGPIGRVIHGSTSQRLARSARCPLLVLPRAVRATETSEATEECREATLASKG